MQTAAFLSPVLFVCCLAPLYAQTAAAGDQGQTPVFRASARAVVVDVVVTRSNDEPVPALTRQDFKVMEDGKPQTIDFFEEHAARTQSLDAPLLARMPPNVYTNIPPTPQSDAVNVLLIDTLNTERRDQMYVHNQILQFLNSMQPGTRAAIFILGSKLRFVQGFTTDTAVLRAALEDKKNGLMAEKDPSSRSRQDDADDRQVVDTLAKMQTAAAGLDAIRESQADFADYQFGDRISITLGALNYLSRYLAGVPGRKNLIWFASSFPVTIFPSSTQSPARSSEHSYTSAVRQTADLLTNSDVAVYPVSAEGIMSGHGMEENSADPGTWATPNPGWGDANERANTIFAMEKLASDTGGKAFYNTNNLSAAISSAINDGSHYYTLVYTPANKKMDGKYRRIEVALAEGKFKLAYRRGYNADDSPAIDAKTDHDPLQALLTHGLPGATQLMYRVKVVPADPQPAPNAARAGKNSHLAGPVTRYKLDFAIRWSDVRLENVIRAIDLKADPNSKGVWHSKISFGVMAYDRDGNAVNWFSATPEAYLEPDMYAAVQKASLVANGEIDLPSGDLELETAIYDWGSGKAGTLEIPLHIVPATPIAAQQAAPKTQ